MVLAWVPLDVDTDDRHAPSMRNLDPAEIHDAYEELLSLLERPAWHAQAACRGQGVAAWFPGRGEDTRPAKQVCHTCPVRSECLAEGVAQPGWGDAGIWGGTSARERRQLRKSTTVDTAA